MNRHRHVRTITALCRPSPPRADHHRGPATSGAVLPHRALKTPAHSTDAHRKPCRGAGRRGNMPGLPLTLALTSVLAAAVDDADRPSLVRRLSVHPEDAHPEDTHPEDAQPHNSHHTDAAGGAAGARAASAAFSRSMRLPTLSATTHSAPNSGPRTNIVPTQNPLATTAT